MKKAAAGFLAVLLLLAGGFCTVAWSVDQEKDQVNFSQQVLLGDPSCADGLTISTRAHYDDHLFWDIEYRLGEAPSALTDYHFSAVQQNGPMSRRWGGIRLESSLEVADQERLQSDEKLTGINRAYQELWKEMGTQRQGEKTVDLRDYYEYFPLGFDMDLPDVLWTNMHYDRLSDGVPNCEKDVIKRFRQFFRIPVPENSVVTIDMTKTEDGTIRYIGYSSSSSSCYTPQTISGLTRDQCFFTLDNRDANGQKLDTSLIPGGYGLYSFSYEPVEESRGIGGNFTGIHAETLSLFFPLDEETKVVLLQADAREENLIMITIENKQYYFNVIRISDHELIQKFVLMEDRGTGPSIDPHDDFWVFTLENRLILVERQENGTYVLKFQVDQQACSEYLGFHGFEDMDFDGEKLAVAGYLYGGEYDNLVTCGFYLMVCDKTGLLYCGHYPCSLTRNPNDQEYQFNCVPYDIKVQWK